jgi:hypothetical protein
MYISIEYYSALGPGFYQQSAYQHHSLDAC